MATKPIYLKAGWRRLGPAITRRWPAVNPFEHQYTAKSLGTTGSYVFRLYVSPTTHRVVAGCRVLTLEDYQLHIAKTYGDDVGKRVATRLILENFRILLDEHRTREAKAKARAFVRKAFARKAAAAKRKKG